MSAPEEINLATTIDLLSQATNIVLWTKQVQAKAARVMDVFCRDVHRQLGGSWEPSWWHGTMRYQKVPPLHELNSGFGRWQMDLSERSDKPPYDWFGMEWRYPVGRGNPDEETFYLLPASWLRDPEAWMHGQLQPAARRREALAKEQTAQREKSVADAFEALHKAQVRLRELGVHGE